MLTKENKYKIESVITECLRNKFKNYIPKNNYMPFHFRLLGKDRLALYSFMQSLFTTFGTSIFEPVASTIAKMHFAKVETQYTIGKEISVACQREIQKIINTLTYNPIPNKTTELQSLRSGIADETTKLKTMKVDLFVQTKEGEEYYFDLKTVKPNKGDFQKYKQTLLEWAGIRYTQDKQAKIHTLIAIPYNPYHPAPYQFWTMAGMLEASEEFLVAENFWDFLGGKGCYDELLDCFEKVGMLLRFEIDDYFAKFNKE